VEPAAEDEARVLVVREWDYAAYIHLDDGLAHGQRSGGGSARAADHLRLPPTQRRHQHHNTPASPTSRNGAALKVLETGLHFFFGEGMKASAGS